MLLLSAVCSASDLDFGEPLFGREETLVQEAVQHAVEILALVSQGECLVDLRHAFTDRLDRMRHCVVADRDEAIIAE
jgi:hypothetical protein